MSEYCNTCARTKFSYPDLLIAVVLGFFISCTVTLLIHGEAINREQYRKYCKKHPTVTISYEEYLDLRN